VAIRNHLVQAAEHNPLAALIVAQAERVEFVNIRACEQDFSGGYLQDSSDLSKTADDFDLADIGPIGRIMQGSQHGTPSTQQEIGGTAPTSPEIPLLWTSRILP
jgi:hypothetical protein